jgi:hypothetical protein
LVTNDHLPIRVEDTAFERHYTPKQLADLWLLHECTIRRLFLDEPGVLKYGKACRRDGRRDYVTLRIPESVARRVYARRSR